MDTHNRYQDVQKNVVVTGFYGFDFLGKSSPKEILHIFETCLGALQKERMIQISSDGPDENL